jgi:hypothetical protein
VTMKVDKAGRYHETTGIDHAPGLSGKGWSHRRNPVLADSYIGYYPRIP